MRRVGRLPVNWRQSPRNRQQRLKHGDVNWWVHENDIIIDFLGISVEILWIPTVPCARARVQFEQDSR